MRSNSHNLETGGLASDPQAETAIEEPMWKLRLSEADAYPERPSVAVCKYYLRTGVCGFGASCRFNHIRDGVKHADVVKDDEELYPERVGQPLCKHYMTTKSCKFGSSCKYDHPKDGDRTNISFNYQGYPIRLGEKECSYFVRTGQCKFGAICKFHHPQPANNSHAPAAKVGPTYASGHLPTVHTPVHPSPILAPQPYGMIPGYWQVLRTPPFVPGPCPYLPEAYGPTMLRPGTFPMLSWGPYQMHTRPVISSGVQPALGSGVQYGMSHLSASALPYAGVYPLKPPSVGALSINQKEPNLAESPSQPDCRNYSKTGYCKYGPSCKYRHPPQVIAPKTTPDRGETDLPLHPVVTYFIDYAQDGVGQFGSSYEFNRGTGPGGPSSSSSYYQPNICSESTKGTI